MTQGLNRDVAAGERAELSKLGFCACALVKQCSDTWKRADPIGDHTGEVSKIGMGREVMTTSILLVA